MTYSNIEEMKRLFERTKTLDDIDKQNLLVSIGSMTPEISCEVYLMQQEIDRLTIENAALREQTRWIPVEEGVPEDHKLVYAISRLGVQFVGYMENFKWLTQEDENYWQQVTYWHPLLPEPLELNGGRRE